MTSASVQIRQILSSYFHTQQLKKYLLPALYPILKTTFHLDFGHIGLITLTNQVTASLLQPVIGSYTDRRPQPYSLCFGMGSTLLGLLLLSVAPTFGLLLIAAAFVGLGSAVFGDRFEPGRDVDQSEIDGLQDVFDRFLGPRRR